LFGGADHLVALDLSLVMELTQSYLLLVDDVMDRSEQRRGGPTMQLQYWQTIRMTQSGPTTAHASNMLAITVGLMAQHLAAAQLSATAVPAGNIRRAEQLFHRNLLATSSGQIDDMLGSIGQPGDLEQTLYMYGLKSGYYTFINPLQMGAALAGADDAALAALRTLGWHAGIAFQLHDDLLGMFGDVQQTGKSSLDDLREGKLTVLIQHALAHADVAQRQLVQRALGNKKVTVRQRAAVQQVLEVLGSRQYVQDRAAQEMQTALGVLDVQQGWRAEPLGFVRSLLQQLLYRDR
jgi:geranylgeranyl diphosphate synthase type I